MTFSELGLSAPLCDLLAENKYNQPYPIQEQAIPLVLQGYDVLGIAPTGSGKTASFALPILQNLQGNTQTKNRHINVLVLVPTRELCMQVQSVFRDFAMALPDRVKSLPVFGGASINPQMMSLQNVNVLVATPGRLLDLINSNALSLSALSTFILDEADKMLNLGFKDEMEQIFKLLPKKRQSLFFSATLSPDVQHMHAQLLTNAKVVQIEQEETKVSAISQVAYRVTQEKKGPLLRFLIKSKKMDQVLVFTSSTQQADRVCNKLVKNGYNARAVHSKKSQGFRNQALIDFKHKGVHVLVATDLLSRGIDIEQLPFVINYELPRSPKDFIHRVGRTGRSKNMGEAITLITPEDASHFKVIQKKMKVRIDEIDSEQLDY